MKKIAALVTAVVLIAAAAIGVTIAYATEANVETHVYTTGKVDISFNSMNLEANVNVLPGTTVSKTVKIKSETGSNPAWIWFTVTMPAVGEGRSLVQLGGMGTGWTDLGSKTVEGSVVYTFGYDMALPADSTTTAGMTDLTFAGQIDRMNGAYYWVVNGQADEIPFDLRSFKISFDAYAVECTSTYDTFDKAYVAWNAARTEGVSSEAELKEAIIDGGDIILDESFSVSGTISVPGNMVTTISGNGNTISRMEGFTGDMFKLADGAELITDNITLDGGSNSGIAATGNLIHVPGNANVILEKGTVLENNSGAVAVRFGTNWEGTLTLNGDTIRNNTASDGAAIYGGGEIIMNEGSEISGNTSTGSGAGVRMVRGTFTMNGGKITGNTAQMEGGGVYAYNYCKFFLNGGEICYNTAGTSNYGGGGLYTGNNAVLTITDIELHHNTSGTDAGGIRLASGTVMTMTGGKIYENTARKHGGGIYGYASSAYITGGSITNNTSTSSTGGVYMDNSKTVEIADGILSGNYTTPVEGEKTESNRFVD